MSRKKQKTQVNNSQQLKNQIEARPYSGSFIPQYPLTNKFTSANVPDSLQRFQWELQNSLLQQREFKKMLYQNQPKNRRRVQTQYIEEEEDLLKIPTNKLHTLQKQVEQLKGQLNSTKNNNIEDKLDKLLEEMVKNRQLDKQLFKQQRNSIPSQPPNNIFYPPMPMYPQQPQQNPPYESRHRQRYDRTSSTFQNKSKNPKNRTPRRLLRKYFFVVLFTKFIKKQSKVLAKLRKQNLRKFYMEKFDMQMLNLKNWLVQGHGYAFPVILEKQQINLEYWLQKRQLIERQKQSLLLNLIKLGLEKMKKECTSPKVSLFSQILHNLCMRGSFVMSRFWSAYQMEKICISQFYGCIRADETLQKYLIGMVVFVKMLIFNMFLQPHKFDPINFPKSKKNLTNNMFILGSVIYRLLKQILKEYLDEKRAQYFKLGNWLNVKQQFIVECCEPLKFNCDYPEQGEYISGLIDSQLQILQMRNEWGQLKQKIKDIIDILHKQLVKRRKDTIRTQKFKLYN